MQSNLKGVINLFARQEVVSKKQWMDDSQFLNLVGATNLIPGPNSTELAIHLGEKRAGWKGLLAAGALFILPAVIITGFIAWLYKEYSSLPQVEPFVYGIKPAIIAVILIAVYPLARAAIKNTALAIVAVVALILALAGLSEIWVMFGLGAAYLLYHIVKDRGTIKSIFPILAFGSFSISNTGLFLTFLKIGSILYGSGYVLFAFIDSEIVETGILSRQVLIDAIAVGQFTPGPVFSSVTFIGYQINGLWGAVVSTIGIFLPSFIFVALLSRLMHLGEKSVTLKLFLDAVNVASVAVIAAVCWQMGRDSIVDWRTIAIAVISLAILILKPKTNSALIVLFGGLAGYLLTLI
jgi:chromate transporter